METTTKPDAVKKVAEAATKGSQPVSVQIPKADGKIQEKTVPALSRPAEEQGLAKRARVRRTPTCGRAHYRAIRGIDIAPECPEVLAVGVAVLAEVVVDPDRCDG